MLSDASNLAVLITCKDANAGNIVFSVMEEDEDLMVQLPWGIEFFEWCNGLVAMVVPRSCVKNVAELVQALGWRFEVAWDREVDAIAPEQVTSLIAATIQDREYVAACCISTKAAARVAAAEGDGFGM